MTVAEPTFHASSSDHSMSASFIAQEAWMELSDSGAQHVDNSQYIHRYIYTKFDDIFRCAEWPHPDYN
jgi:hypothetical protein